MFFMLQVYTLAMIEKLVHNIVDRLRRWQSGQLHVAVDHAGLPDGGSNPSRRTMEVLLWIVVGMIAYDLSIHLIYLFGEENFFLRHNINYWPNWTGRQYQIFWSIFWGIALVFLIAFATNT